MPEESDPNAQNRFARDLSRIREDRAVSLAVVQEATQVPLSRLHAFEEGELLDDQSRLNVVYLKAFIRAYAEAIGLPPAPVVDHVEPALAGDYQNELAVRFLDDPDGGAASSSSKPESSDREPTSDEMSSSSPKPSEKKTPTDPEDTEGTDGEPSKVHEDLSQSVEAGDSVSGTNQDQEASLRSFSKGSSPSTARTDRGGWRQNWKIVILAATVVGLLALSAWGIATGPFSADPPPASPPPRDSGSAPQNDASGVTVQKTGDTTLADPMGMTDSIQASEPQPASVSLLQDTMHVLVRARSVVREMRVQQDDDLRRPYWMEQGEAMVFPFARRITIENQLDSLRLFLEGHPYPVSHANAEGRIVVTRDTAKRFADTLRGAPVSLSISPDTAAIKPVQSPRSVSTNSDTTDGPS